jgi:outer membrane protein
MLFRIFTALVLCFGLSSVASADIKVGVVDFTRAIEETADGQAAQGRLDAMFQGKRAELEQLESGLRSLTEEYQSRAAMLSDAARADYEQRLGEAQMVYQQTYQRNDAEMQEAYMQVMEQLFAGLKVVAQSIGAEEGYTIILESAQGAVLYTAPTVDITDLVIQRVNAGN